MDFRKGQTVYKQDGTEFCFDHVVGDYAFCHPIVIIQTTNYTGDDFEEHEDIAGHLVRVKLDELSSNPWIAKINEDTKAAMAEAQSKLDDIKSQIGDAAISLQEMKRELHDFEKAAKTRPDLSLVLDFVHGRITHCAVGSEHYGYKVMPLKDALTYNDRYDKGLKLVTFFGDQGRAVARMNRYSDGSGSDFDIFPFKSEAEGLEWIEKRKNELADMWRNAPDDASKNKALNQLKSQGGKLPDDVVKHISEGMAKAKEERVKLARQELEKAMALPEAFCNND